MTSPWLSDSEPLSAERAPLPAQTDIVVIGGGVAGTSTALHLARAGAPPLLLEAGVVAGRASGRNDGQLLLGLGEHYNRIVGQFGAERARLLWRFIRDNHDELEAEAARSAPDAGLARGGGLRLAETPHELDELQQAAALLAAERIEHRLLDAASVAELLPAIGFHGALELPGESIVHPVRLVRGFARAAREAGAKIYERTPVTRVEPRAGGFDVTLASGAQLRTSVVVHCTSTLARELDASGFLAAKLFPFRGQVLASTPLSPAVAARFGARAMSSNFCYEYFRLYEDRFLVGGMRWSVRGEEQGTLDDSTHNPDVTRNLLDYVRRHFPILADTRFPQVWTGIMAGTPDGLPLVGALPATPGAFCLLGFNGYGLSFAFLAGQVLAQQILEGRADHAAAGLFAPRRFG